MVSIALIGRTSYLSQEYRRQYEGLQDLDIIESREIESADLSSYDVVVNFAIHPSFKNEPYCRQTDVDATVAGLLVNCRAHFIMLSSRTVYDHDVAYGARETDAVIGANQYGANKAESEGRIIELLGERCSILRIGNVFGYEVEKNRHSFAAIMLRSLRETGEICFDVSPFTRRDFVPTPVFCQILKAFVEERRAGIFNVGSGIGLEVGHLPLWIIQGHGSGSVRFTSAERRDEFKLDISKLKQIYGDVCTPDDIKRFCQSIGKQFSDG